MFSKYTIPAVLLLCMLQLANISCQTMDQIIAEAAQSSMALDFVQDDQTVLVEMDIKYNKSQWEEIERENDIFNRLEEQQEGGQHTKRKAIRYESQRWTNRVIPYRIAGGFSYSDKGQISAAMEDWEKYTCLDFRPASYSDSNYINIENGGGCSSYVGMNGGSQSVTLAPGCRVKGVIIHELGHAIGFHHEQTRPDRDGHVQILYQNIMRGVEYNFQKYSTSVINDHGVPYDYSSIMHYGQYAFSANGQTTIRTIDSSKQRVIGNRQSHSFKDIKLANAMYGCSSHCAAKSCPGEGFLNKDCKCWCPGNPVKDCDGGDGGDGGGDGDGTGSGDCTDIGTKCASWASIGQCTRYPDYMSTNCKKSCKICTDDGDDGDDGGEEADCEDLNRYCRTWASWGYCTKGSYPPYMKIHCKKSCKLCSTEGEVTTGCHDYNSSCGYWARIGECSNNPSYMMVSCRKSCGC